MPNNPDERPRRLAGHVYSVEALDLSHHGFPGLAFTGDLHIEPTGDEWYIESIYSADPVTDLSRSQFATAINQAVAADKVMSSDIMDECVRHGEG